MRLYIIPCSVLTAAAMIAHASIRFLVGVVSILIFAASIYQVFALVGVII